MSVRTVDIIGQCHILSIVISEILIFCISWIFSNANNIKSNYWTGFGKWHDHAVTGSRACPMKEGEWASSEGRIISDDGVITFPKGENPKNYTIDIKWKENGAIQQISFQLD